jgi:hypothetical protein
LHLCTKVVSTLEVFDKQICPHAGISQDESR